METVRVEHCLKCNSSEMRNYNFVRPGKPIRVYVRCAKCDAFVCRYALKRYTSNEPYESLLQIIHQGEDYEQSGRELKRHIGLFTSKVEEEFGKVLRMAEEKGDARRMEEIIVEKKPELE